MGLVLGAVLTLLAASAQAATTLNTLDLSKNFQDGHYNVTTDPTYAKGAVVLVPAPADGDLFMVSVQQDQNAQCAASGVMSRKNSDNTLTYYMVIHVMNLQANEGHCFIGIHVKTKDTVKQAFVDLFAQ